MGELGKLNQTFVGTIQGINFATPLDFQMPGFGLRGSVSSEDSRIVLKVEISNTEEVAGSRLGIRVAEEFWGVLVAEFSYHIRLSSEVRLESSNFAPSAISGAAPVRVKVAEQLLVNDCSTVTLFNPDASEITALANNVDWKLKVPEMAILTDLYTARKMFFVGMQIQDHAARFLILYSAVCLASLFKSSNCSQSTVDDLFKLANSSLPFSTIPSGPKKGKYESLYAKLRNNFVHAEGRGKDPVTARHAIESHSPEFQKDVSILLWKKL